MVISYDTNVIDAAYPNEQERITAFGNWVGQVATRYKNIIDSYEIWNEQNTERFWPGVTAESFKPILKTAYESIKSVDVNLVVISGGIAPAGDTDTEISPVRYIRDMYNNGMNQYFDAIGWHPYSFPSMPYENASWSMWYMLTEVHNIMYSHGEQNKKIWFTEFGAPTESDRGIGEDGQFETIRQVIEIARSDSRLGPIFLYSLIDNDSRANDMEGHFGVYKDDFTPKSSVDKIKKFLGNG